VAGNVRGGTYMKRDNNTLHRFEYIDRETCPDMSWAGDFSLSKLCLHCEDLNAI